VGESNYITVEEILYFETEVELAGRHEAGHNVSLKAKYSPSDTVFVLHVDIGAGETGKHFSKQFFSINDAVYEYNKWC
jgi:hypothetical protein